MLFRSTTTTLLLLLAGTTFAHPGHNDELDDEARYNLYERHAIAARRCSNSLRARHAPNLERLHARRAAILAGEVSPSNLIPRQTTNSTDTGFNGTGMPGNMTGGGGMGGSSGGSTSFTATATAVNTFATEFPSTTVSASLASETTQAADGACVLSPETVVGPYYIEGESIRSNLVESETGLPFYAEFLVYDINDCSPLSTAAIDIWSCNATGEYGGFVSSDSTSNLDTSQYNGELAHVGDQNDAGSTITDTKTALRGQQLTDDNGIAQFITLLPGWYSGRTAHIHIRVHVGGEVSSNGTYIGGNITHTGQTFFGEDLYTNMQGIYPYSSNSVIRTTNADDSIYQGSNGTASQWNLYYVVPGDLSQGIIGYVNVMVDSTATNEGLQDTGSGGAGGPGGNGTMSIMPTSSTNSTATGTAAADSASNTTSTNGSSVGRPMLHFFLILASHFLVKVLA